MNTQNSDSQQQQQSVDIQYPIQTQEATQKIIDHPLQKKALSKFENIDFDIKNAVDALLDKTSFYIAYKKSIKEFSILGGISLNHIKAAHPPSNFLKLAAPIENDSIILSVSNGDKKIKIWYTSNSKLAFELEEPFKEIKQIFLDDDLQKCLIIPKIHREGYDFEKYEAHIWSIGQRKNQSKIKTLFNPHKGYEVTAAAFSPFNKMLLTGGADGSLCIWNSNTLELLHFQSNIHTDSITSIILDEASRLFYTSSRDSAIGKWDLVDKELQTIFMQGHEDEMYQMKLSIDGRYLFTIAKDYTINFWDIMENKLMYYVDTNFDDLHLPLLISADNQILLTLLPDGKIQKWALFGLTKKRKKIKIDEMKTTTPEKVTSQGKYNLIRESNQENSGEKSLMQKIFGIFKSKDSTIQRKKLPKGNSQQQGKV